MSDLSRNFYSSMELKVIRDFRSLFCKMLVRSIMIEKYIGLDF